MSTFSHQELIELHKAAEEIINAECERDFNLWAESCLKSLEVLASEPDGLRDLLQLFVNDKKHYFFRGYRERIIERVKQGFKKPTPRPLAIEKEAITSLPFNFNFHRDRIFLETYLSCGENSRQTAEKLGIAKSTFHDWKQAHIELIESEKNKCRVN